MMVARLLRNPQSWLFFTLYLVCTVSALEDLKEELQPNFITNGTYDDMNHNNPHLCARYCKADEEPRTCYYKFHLEPYVVLGGACGNCPEVLEDCYRPQCVTADGVERSILTVNRQLPGPSIQVCKGDTIVVDIINHMAGQSTSIHWHGLNQVATPWMDGVPMVTQCPIMEGHTFRYRFKAQDQGTFFWHSHDGFQKGDGIVGTLIIREPDERLGSLYSDDIPSHVVLVQDWMHNLAADRMPGLSKTHVGQAPDTYLIQGKGTFLNTSTLDSAFRGNDTPPAYFYIKPHRSYRFRLISGTCLSCAFRISFQDHPVMVISADDSPIQPEGPFTSVTMSAGERFDVVVKADQPVGMYWIVVQGLGTCSGQKQAAILQYEGANGWPKAYPNWLVIGYTFNLRNGACEEKAPEGICYSQVKHLYQNPSPISGKPDRQPIVMEFGFHSYSDQELYESDKYGLYIVPAAHVASGGMINNIINKVPPSPLLTQYDDIPKQTFCNANDSCLAEKPCNCLNIVKVEEDSVVEFVIADTAAPSKIGLSHPFHFHGHTFFIVKQGIFRQPFRNHLQELLAELTAEDRKVDTFLPGKDTITVPASGYAVVRLHFNNPGFWFWHCHFAFHLTSGMSAIIQVGQPRSRLHQVPRHFPKCYEYSDNEITSSDSDSDTKSHRHV